MLPLAWRQNCLEQCLVATCSIPPRPDLATCERTCAFTAALKFNAIGDRPIERSGQCICVINGDQPAGITGPDHSLHTLQIGGNNRQTASQSFHNHIGSSLRTAGKDKHIRF